jgi:FKBP-type peptidyl-prolyl cis-trans isomerase FkpA
MPVTPMRLRTYLLALFPLVFVACYGDTGTDVAPAIPITSQTFAPSLGVDLTASTKTADGLYYRDITVGTGSVISVNHTIAVYYSGSLPDGTVFDSILSPATPFSFLLGAGQVIAGWDEGLVGMRVGGVRQLIIPSTLGYGAAGTGGKIPPQATLVFTVTMVSTT